LLGDSNDNLEDPNNPSNFFDINDLNLNIYSERHIITHSEDHMLISSGIETPAFGRKKTPSSFFKTDS
jgi:hypothetical protein